MEHGFTWYNLLPHELQAVLPEHTFFAILVSLLVIVFALCARYGASCEHRIRQCRRKNSARATLPNCCSNT